MTHICTMLQKITYITYRLEVLPTAILVFSTEKSQTHSAHWQKVVAKYVALFSLF